MHFLRFSVRQALQGLWRNSVMTFAATFTMILMLILLSALVIVIAGVEAGLPRRGATQEQAVVVEVGRQQGERLRDDPQRRSALTPTLSFLERYSEREAQRGGGVRVAVVDRLLHLHEAEQLGEGVMSDRRNLGEARFDSVRKPISIGVGGRVVARCQHNSRRSFG